MTSPTPHTTDGITLRPPHGGNAKAGWLVAALTRVLESTHRQRAQAQEQFDAATASVRAKTTRERDAANARFEKQTATAKDIKQQATKIAQSHFQSEHTLLTKKRNAALAAALEPLSSKRNRIKKDTKDDLWLAETVTDAEERTSLKKRTTTQQLVNDAGTALEDALQNVGDITKAHNVTQKHLSKSPLLTQHTNNQPASLQTPFTHTLEPQATPEQLAEVWAQANDELEEVLDTFDNMKLPGLISWGSWGAVTLAISGITWAAVFFGAGITSLPFSIAIASVVLVVVVAARFPIASFVCKAVIAQRQPILTHISALQEQLSEAHHHAASVREQEQQDIAARGKAEHERITAKGKAKLEKLDQKESEEQAKITNLFDPKLQASKERFECITAEAENTYAKATAHAAEERDAELQRIDRWEQAQTGDAQQARQTILEQTADAWEQTIAACNPVCTELIAHAAAMCKPWADASWFDFVPAHEQIVDSPQAAIGSVHVDLTKLPSSLPTDASLTPPAASSFDLPITLDTAGVCSLLIEAGRDTRDAGLALLRSIMLRLLCAIPPGSCRFTMIDPVGLGKSFAGFMHLGDASDLLVTGKVWTQARHIEQQLTNLTDHIENVIQKYLRNEYESIEQYNKEAGEIAEPYRFLVIADFPENFTEDAAKRLASILETGPRCGVHTLILADPKATLPRSFARQSMHKNAVVLEERTKHTKHTKHTNTKDADHPTSAFQIANSALADFNLSTLEEASDELLTTLTKRIGSASTDASRVEVPFRSIAPGPAEHWSRSSAKDLRIPLGRSGAQKRQELVLGQGTAQHAVIAGKTGSGKSTLMHVIVTSGAAWFSPDELELYLIDFKAGVEFKTYATHALPHARVVSVETDRRFGLSVLQKVAAILQERGERYRALGVQDLAGFRSAAPSETMPRVLLMIDEFQELFVQDDRIAQEASLLLDRIVRQGRAFGVHAVLGSQTLSGAYAIARSTLGQMAVRIALQTTEADSLVILGEDNPAARLLTRPGEAIYNNSGGLVEANETFQVVWMGDDIRDNTLVHIRDLDETSSSATPRDIVVFEGKAPAPLENNTRFEQAIAAQTNRSTPPAAILGEPLAIKPPTQAVLRDETGANILIVSQDHESALAATLTSICSLCAHNPDAQTIVLDGSRDGEDAGPLLASLATALPGPVRIATLEDAPQALAEITARIDNTEENTAPIYLLAYGLHSFRDITREDSFSFSSYDLDDDASDSTPNAGTSLITLLRDGPRAGIHTIAWCDTISVLERQLGRDIADHFDHRVLGQMSQSDSLTLIDTPEAAQLGHDRLLLTTRSAGTTEPFRPYALPTPGWIRRFADQCLDTPE